MCQSHAPKPFLLPKLPRIALEMHGFAFSILEKKITIINLKATLGGFKN
jgi:hypothetical protein